MGGLLVNVGSEEEEEPLPRAKVSYNTAFSIFKLIYLNTSFLDHYHGL